MDLPAQARTTADLVADLLAGKTPRTTGTTDNGASAVLADGYTTVDALCAGAASADCAAAGITSAG